MRSIDEELKNSTQFRQKYFAKTEGHTTRQVRFRSPPRRRGPLQPDREKLSAGGKGTTTLGDKEIHEVQPGKEAPTAEEIEEKSSEVSSNYGDINSICRETKDMCESLFSRPRVELDSLKTPTFALIL